MNNTSKCFSIGGIGSPDVNYYGMHPISNNKYADMYFTLEITSINEDLAYINYSNSNASYSTSIVAYFSQDGGNSWTEIDNHSTTSIQNIKVGDKILFKSSGGALCWDGEGGSVIYSYGCEYKAYGNIMSLMYGDAFQNKTELLYEYAFAGLFVGEQALMDVSHLILPATTLTNYCYALMFMDCPNINTAPELPATELVSNCYIEMFCTCSSLNYVKMLATEYSGDGNPVERWLDHTASTGTLVRAENGVEFDGMLPQGWTATPPLLDPNSQESIGN